MMEIPSGWLALLFDRNVFQFGRTIDSRMSETDKKGKAKHRLKDVLQKYERSRDGENPTLESLVQLGIPVTSG